jgi:CBS domain-containing protein
MKVSTILATKKPQVITIQPQQPVREAIALYRRYNIGALIVLDENQKLVGILSERDIIRELLETANIIETPVAALMTTKVIVGVPQDSLMSVMNTMTENRFRHLPIMEDDILIGMISIGDVIKAQRDQYRGEIDTLEAQLMADKPE